MLDQPALEQLRAADGKKGGRVRVGDGPGVIIADVRKRSDWDHEEAPAT